MLVEDVENLLNITLDAEEVETLGGWFLTVNNGIKASKILSWAPISLASMSSKVIKFIISRFVLFEKSTSPNRGSIVKVRNLIPLLAISLYNDREKCF